MGRAGRAGTGGAGGTGGTGGTSGAGGTSSQLQFARVGPLTYDFASVECGAAVCYASYSDATSAAYNHVVRLANSATALDDVSNGIGGGTVGTLFVDGADGLTITQYGIGVLARAATASSFVMVGDMLTGLPTARQALARDGNGTLFVGTSTGLVALSSCGTFAPVGSGITFAYAVVTDGTDLYVASSSVKVLRGATGTWMDVGSNSPTGVGDLALDRAGRLYAIGTPAGSTRSVHRLAADGSVWQNVTTGLSQTALYDGLFTNIVFDAQNNAYMIIENGDLRSDTAVKKLAAGGTQWTQLGASGLPIGDESCEWLALDALDRLVAACTDGLYRSSPLP